MKKSVLLLLFVILESCSIQNKGKNGTPGMAGENGKGTENGENGKNGESKSRTFGLKL
jgi:hypothetical protein